MPALVAVGVSSAALAATAPPLHAATVVNVGYGWLVRHGDGAVTSYSTSGKPVVLTKLATGRWDVTFGGIPANPVGVPMVNANNDSPGATCAVEKSFAVAGATPAIHVQFHCGSRAGVPATTGFTVSWTSVKGAHEGWVVTANPLASSTTTTYDWLGQAVTVSRWGTGYYPVTYHGMNDTGGVALATAVEPVFTGRHCVVPGTWMDPGPPETQVHASIRCLDKNGSSADSAAAEHYVAGRGLFTDASALQGYAVVANASALPSAWTFVGASYSYNSKNASTQVIRAAKGVYFVRFDKLAGSKRMAHVDTNVWNASEPRCTADTGVLNPTDAAVGVVCVNLLGQPVDGDFSVTYTARP
jgi:hypothetical protein